MMSVDHRPPVSYMDSSNLPANRGVHYSDQQHNHFVALASTNRGGRPLWTSWLTGGRGKEERGALLGDACSVLSRSPGMWREMHGIGA
eukprot:scaffold117508_cov21-Tisochrysis_lutea.AAC.3